MKYLGITLLLFTLNLQAQVPDELEKQRQEHIQKLKEYQQQHPGWESAPSDEYVEFFKKWNSESLSITLRYHETQCEKDKTKCLSPKQKRDLESQYKIAVETLERQNREGKTSSGNLVTTPGNFGGNRTPAEDNKVSNSPQNKLEVDLGNSNTYNTPDAGTNKPEGNKVNKPSNNISIGSNTPSINVPSNKLSNNKPENKPSDNKVPSENSIGNKPSDNKVPTDNKLVTNKPENRPEDNKLPTDNKLSDNLIADNKPSTDNKPSEDTDVNKPEDNKVDTQDDQGEDTQDSVPDSKEDFKPEEKPEEQKPQELEQFNDEEFPKNYDPKTCEWVEDMPRKIVYGPSFCSRQAVQICTGYVVCERKQGGGKFVRMSSCSPKNCGRSKESAIACTMEQAYYSRRPEDERNHFVSPELKKILTTPKVRAQ